MAHPGMITTRRILFFSFLIIVSILLLYYFKWLIFILIYGIAAGPCVWPSDYEAMGFGSVDDLVYDDFLQCYLKP